MYKKLMAFMLVVVMAVGGLGVQVFAEEAEDVTWEPSSKKLVELSNGNLTAKMNHLTSFVFANTGKSSGKWYWEFKLDNMSGQFITVASYRNYNNPVGPLITSSSFTSGFVSDEKDLPGIKEGDLVGCALDLDNSTFTIYVNGVQQNSVTHFNKLDGALYYPALQSGYNETTANFGASPFEYEIPNGYLPYNVKEGSETGSRLSVLLETNEQTQLSLSQDLALNAEYIWSSEDATVATVDTNGLVTAVGEGVAKIYAESQDGTFKEYISVRVSEKIADELRIALDLNVGKSARLYLSDNEDIVWTSMDPSVATVDETGKVTAVKKGLAIIQAEDNGETYQIYVRAR